MTFHRRLHPASLLHEVAENIETVERMVREAAGARSATTCRRRR